MKKYEVTGAFVTINEGSIILSRSQFKAREHCLSFVKEISKELALFDITKPTGFKRGEVFQTDYEPSKAIAGSLLWLDEPNGVAKDAEAAEKPVDAKKLNKAKGQEQE